MQPFSSKQAYNIEDLLYQPGFKELNCYDLQRKLCKTALFALWSQPKLLNNFLQPAATGTGWQRKHCMYGRAIPAPSDPRPVQEFMYSQQRHGLL